MPAPPASPAAALVRLYGVPLSQPFRSVAWTLLQIQIPFEVQMTVPGSTHPKIGSQTTNYKSKSIVHTTNIPLLEDVQTGFTIVESPAILSHLCERFFSSSSSVVAAKSLYGDPGSRKKATIDSYMHWHHHNTRSLARLAFPYLRKESPKSKTMGSERDYQRVYDTLQLIEDGWLSSASKFSKNDLEMDSAEVIKDEPCYIASTHQHTIADILAYEEIIQLVMMGILKKETLYNNYPKVYAWTERMSQLPFHEEVHASLAVLGDVTATTIRDDDSSAFMKRLGTATRAVLKALSEAQKVGLDGATMKNANISRL